MFVRSSASNGSSRLRFTRICVLKGSACGAATEVESETHRAVARSMYSRFEMRETERQRSRRKTTTFGLKRLGSRPAPSHPAWAVERARQNVYNSLGRIASHYRSGGKAAPRYCLCECFTSLLPSPQRSINPYGRDAERRTFFSMRVPNSCMNGKRVVSYHTVDEVAEMLESPSLHLARRVTIDEPTSSYSSFPIHSCDPAMSALVLFPLRRNTHLMERSKRSEDGSSEPRRVHSLSG